VRSDSSATRADLLDDRTAEKVAAARTRVPPAVASDEMVCQSATYPPHSAGEVLIAAERIRDICTGNGFGSWAAAGVVSRPDRWHRG
jgi:hypothetical protein